MKNHVLSFADIMAKYAEKPSPSTSKRRSNSSTGYSSYSVVSSNSPTGKKWWLWLILALAGGVVIWLFAKNYDRIKNWVLELIGKPNDVTIELPQSTVSVD